MFNWLESRGRNRQNIPKSDVDYDQLEPVSDVANGGKRADNKQAVDENAVG